MRGTLRRGLATVGAAVLAATALSLSVGGSASAEIPRSVPAQTATPPPPGSGVEVIVGGPTAPEATPIPTPQPLGPVSFT